MGDASLVGSGLGAAIGAVSLVGLGLGAEINGLFCQGAGLSEGLDGTMGVPGSGDGDGLEASG